jgi:hypothetical protein
MDAEANVRNEQQLELPLDLSASPEDSRGGRQVLCFATVVNREPAYLHSVRRIEKIDETKNDGYSLLGTWDVDGLSPREPGVYVIKVRGNFRSSKWDYYVVRVTGAGAEVLQTLEDARRDWAVRLWPTLKAAGIRTCEQ